MLSEQPGNVRPFTYFAILKYLCALNRVQVREPRLRSEGRSLSPLPTAPLTRRARCVAGPLPTFRSQVLRILLLGSHMGFSPTQECPPSHLRPCSALLQEGVLGACWFPSWLAFGRKRAKPRHTPRWTLQFHQCNLSCSVSLLEGSCPLRCAVGKCVSVDRLSDLSRSHVGWRWTALLYSILPGHVRPHFVDHDGCDGSQILVYFPNCKKFSAKKFSNGSIS